MNLLKFLKSEDEMSRKAYSLRNRKMVYGCWADLLDQKIGSAVGHDRASHWGPPDVSHNVYKAICEQVAVRYDGGFPSLEGSDELTEVISNSNRWPLMGRVERDVAALREMLIRVDVYDGELVYRPVFPDEVSVICNGNNPTKPTVIMEERKYILDGNDITAYEVFDITDKQNPSYKIIAEVNNEEVDLTSEIDPDFAVGSYPWVYADRTPFLPYTFFRATATGDVFDPYAASELSDGTLVLGVGWAFAWHCFLEASFPIKIIINGEIPDAVTQEQDKNGHLITKVKAVTPDPTRVLRVTPTTKGEAVIITQWTNTTNVSELMEILQAQEHGLATHAGLSSADLIRTGADPRSGMALSISREALRAIQRKNEAIFRSADIELTKKTAALLNSVLGTSFPETGYSITYKTLPYSPAERKEIREGVFAEYDRGFVSRKKAFERLYPEKSSQEIEAEMAQIDAEKQAKSEAFAANQIKAVLPEDENEDEVETEIKEEEEI